MKNSFSIIQKTKGKLPRLPFRQIKEKVLGPSFELSLVFVGNATSKKLNNKYRGKNKPTNILSFPLSKNSGEIFINPILAEKQSSSYDLTPRIFLGKLLIHGMLHLKGFEHGSRMERIEAQFVKKFFS